MEQAFMNQPTSLQRVTLLYGGLTPVLFDIPNDGRNEQTCSDGVEQRQPQAVVLRKKVMLTAASIR